jgi:hypothetical protein
MHPKPEDDEPPLLKSNSPNHQEGAEDGDVPVDNLIQLDT